AGRGVPQAHPLAAVRGVRARRDRAAADGEARSARRAHPSRKRRGIVRIDRPEEAHKRFPEAFTASDLEALAAMYDRGARLVAQPGQVVAGAGAIRAALQQFLALKGTMSIEQQFAIQAEGLALTRASWTIRGTAADGSPLELRGSTSEVLRRQPDGSWLF